MLPRPVVEQMKQHKDLTAQYYKEVSVLFSDIVGFAHMVNNSSPGQVVDMLNDVYAFYDEQIDKFDVYKVEMLVDCFMIASGMSREFL